MLSKLQKSLGWKSHVISDIVYPYYSILVTLPQANREQDTVFCEIQTVKKSHTNLPPLSSLEIPKPALSNRNRIQTTNVTHICNFKSCSNHTKKRNMKLILMFYLTQQIKDIISKSNLYQRSEWDVYIYSKSETQGASDTCTSPFGLATFRALCRCPWLVALLLFAQI